MSQDNDTSSLPLVNPNGIDSCSDGMELSNIASTNKQKSCRKLLSEVTAENLSSCIRFEPGRSRRGTRPSLKSSNLKSEEPERPRQLLIFAEDGTKLSAVFRDAIRSGDEEEVATILDNNWPQILNCVYTMKLKFERTVRVDDEEANEDDNVPAVANGDDPDGGLFDHVKFFFKPFHLALLSKYDNIVELMLDKALTENPEKCDEYIDILLGSRTKIEFPKYRELKCYEKVDRMLDGMSSLHVAARYNPVSLQTMVDKLTEHGLLDSLQRHLEQRDRQLEQTPLHVAARSSATVASKILIDAGSEIEALDFNGYTPLYAAAKAGSEANTLLLLECGANPNIPGYRNKTPIHEARTQKIVQHLLDFGADPYIKINEKYDHGGDKVHTAFNSLLFRNPKTAEPLLNAGIDTNGQDLDSTDLLIIYDLEMFYHESFGSEQAKEDSFDEVAGIAKIVSLRAGDLLKHPLTELMLHMKWRRIKRVFWMNLGIYIAFVLCLTSMAAMQTWMVLDFDEKDGGKTHDECAVNNSFADICWYDRIYEETNQTIRMSFDGVYYVVCVFTGLLVMRETVQAIYSWNHYKKSREDLLEFVMLITITSYLLAIRFGPRVINTHLGCWSIFMAWIEMTMLVGRFPAIGIYVFMFTNVIRTVLLFLMVYSPAMIAFSMAFHILLPHQTLFSNPLMAMLKTGVMMIGELEFSDSFTWAAAAAEGAQVSCQVLFVLFLIFLTIIIMNLLLGLTVSKTEELFKTAGLIRLEKTAKQISIIEDAFVHKPTIVQFLPSLIGDAIKESTSIFAELIELQPNFERTFKVCVRPYKHKVKRKGEKKSWLYTQNNTADDNLKIYFYDDFKGGIGRPTGHKIPQWIVGNTQALLEAREQTDWQQQIEAEQREALRQAQLISEVDHKPKGGLTRSSTLTRGDSTNLMDILENMRNQIDRLTEKLAMQEDDA